MGIHRIFDRRHSELSGIIEDETVYVTKAIHKAIIEVNERGTEAAASTGKLTFIVLAAFVPVLMLIHFPLVLILRCTVFYLKYGFENNAT